MKLSKFYVLASFCASLLATAQIPTGYYDGTSGLTGYTLKTKLSQIITNGHNDMGYGSGTGGLWTAYYTTDVDKYYENDGSVLDMYSERPKTTDAYEYKLGTNQCGNGKNNEYSCYNREHSLPKVYFGGINATPMSHDAHFVIPTDYYVNNQRGDLFYGETSAPIMTFSNGTKIGPSSFPGYSGTVFEPIDEFKGDFARMYFYFITRYESKLPSFYNINRNKTPFDGSTGRGFQPWIINMLLKWSANDPVSQREIDRNNAVYNFQGNRNPYIDHPEWISQIWTSTLATGETTTKANQFAISPNPVKNRELTVTGDKLPAIEEALIFNISGQLVQRVKQPFKSSNKIALGDLPKGIYVLQAGSATAKFIIE